MRKRQGELGGPGEGERLMTTVPLGASPGLSLFAQLPRLGQTCEEKC